MIPLLRLQAMGVVPTISVDKTDYAEIYLSDKSMKAEIVTAKSSAINVSVPDGTGDFVSIHAWIYTSSLYIYIMYTCTHLSWVQLA